MKGVATFRLALGAALVLSACSGSSPSGPNPAATPLPPFVTWQLAIENLEGAPFSVRMRVDGELVYDGSALSQTAYLMGFERRRSYSTHKVELEIVEARRSPSLYRQQCFVTGDRLPGISLSTPVSIARGGVLELTLVD